MRARTAAPLAFLAGAALALPLAPRQDARLPYVGAPPGDLFVSAGELQCELLRITYGGGEGPPYSINFVKPPPSHNASLDDIEVLERLGVLGMPGFTWFDLDSAANLTAGEAVALQIVDRTGQAGYSVNRHVREARLNEYCHLPGSFWPPSRWDGTHFSIMLLAIFLGIPFAWGFLSSFKQEWSKARAAARLRALEASSSSGGGAGDVPLQDRSGETTHVLGDGDDDERTSLEDEDRPLLQADGGAHEPPPESAPPGYEEAIKEDTPGRRSGEEARV
ncbi:hypothetical protein JCM10450v2_000637 [Rhodotorula kratochvilovae]